MKPVTDHTAHSAKMKIWVTGDPRPFTRTCPECARVFDLTNKADAAEVAAGHDCEV